MPHKGNCVEHYITTTSVLFMYHRIKRRDMFPLQCSQLFLVQQTMPVEEGQLDNYKESLKTYAEKTATCAGCLL